ncbi:8-oxo-dGTP diphosphatase [Sulfolobus tengchongensis]|uniref:Oxidized purine nucleoside triphosphate hydrolase n=1 Tax=Sulfolobus tengchongensis TaxID=207809 RepID=A0AAX4KY83_9CREN
MYTCITLVLNKDKILMIYKKRGLGRGLFSFPGGKVEHGENGKECAIRELKEETMLIAKEVECAGKILFKVDGEDAETMEVYIVRKFEGIPMETDEAIPIWVNIDEIPYDKMWEDDKHWVPLVIEGRKIECEFYFSNNWEKFDGGSCIFK